VERRLVCCNK